MEKLKNIAKWLLPLLVGGGLFWWIYQKMNLDDISVILDKGLRWEWIGVFCLLFFVPFILRGLRWQQLIEPIHPQCRLRSTILSVFVGFGANLLFPRVGEVVRCGLLKQYEGLPFGKTVGTVITERVFDLICLLLMTLVVILSQMNVFMGFLKDHPESINKLSEGWLSWKTFLVLGLCVAACIGGWQWLKRRGVYQKIRHTLHELWEGMKSIRTLRHPGRFMIYTVLIWLGYFASFYVGQYFFHVPFQLSLMAMITANVMGSFGVVAPVQGGIGAWHFMVIYTLVFYGVPESQAGIFALAVHGINTVLTIVTALVAWAWLSIENKLHNGHRVV